MAISDSLVIDAFDALGGDPTSAVAHAAKHSSVDDWVMNQAAQAGAAGIGAMAIPGAHLVGLAADTAFLMRKLAHTCWGIGELRGCVVMGKSDFNNILGLWSGALTHEDLPHKAISKAMFESAMIAGATTIAGVSVAAIAANLTGQQVAMLGGRIVGSLAARKLVGKSVNEASQLAAGKFGGKMGAKVAGKCAAKFGTKLGAKAFAGMFPLIGAAVGGGINVYFINDMAKHADKYYSSYRAEQTEAELQEIEAMLKAPLPQSW